MKQSSLFDTCVLEIDRLMSWFSYTKKDLGYGVRWTFDNGMRFDLIDYKKKWENILRVWRGAWLVRQNPLLHDWFDEVMIVLAKLEIKDINDLQQKHFIGVFQLLHDAPSNIGAFD